jgi:hypothetical protein
MGKKVCDPQMFLVFVSSHVEVRYALNYLSTHVVNSNIPV